MPTEAFIKDEARGKVLEDFTESYFRRLGWSVSRAKGHVPAYDLIVTRDRSSLLIECKADYKTHYTGNFALERDALAHSKADYWVIAEMNLDGTIKDAYLFPIATLNLIYPKYSERQMGEFLNNVGVLVPKDSLTIYAQRL